MFILILEGHVMSLLDLQATYQDEYNALDDKERDKLIQEFKENVDTTKAIRRPSPRGRIQDVSNTLRNVRLLVSSTFSLSSHTVLTCHCHSLMGSSCVVVLRDSFALWGTHLTFTWRLNGISLAKNWPIIWSLQFVRNGTPLRLEQRSRHLRSQAVTRLVSVGSTTYVDLCLIIYRSLHKLEEEGRLPQNEHSWEDQQYARYV